MNSENRPANLDADWMRLSEKMVQAQHEQAQRMTTDARLRNAQLQVAIESLQQDAANAMDMRREHALRAGHEQMDALEASGRHEHFWIELIIVFFLEGVLAIGVNSYSAQLDTLGWWKHVVVVLIIVLFLMIVVPVVGYRWWLLHGRQNNREFLKSTLQRISLAYLAHSQIDNQIQTKRQQKVAHRTWLMPYDGDPWREILASGNTEFVLHQINAIVKIDSGMLTWQTRFDERGGKFALEIYQAVLRNQLPWIIATYIIDATRTDYDDRFVRWKREALTTLATRREIDDRLDEHIPFHNQVQSVHDHLVQVVDATTAFSYDNLTKLTQACKHLFRFDSQSLVPDKAPMSFQQCYFPK